MIINTAAMIIATTRASRPQPRMAMFAALIISSCSCAQPFMLRIVIDKLVIRLTHAGQGYVYPFWIGL